MVRTAADAYLLRLAHQFGLGEDPLLSLPATVGHHRVVAAWVCEEGLEPSLAVLHHHHHHHHLLYPHLHLLHSHHLHSHHLHSHHFFYHLPSSPPSPSPPPGRRCHTLRQRRAAGSREHRGALTHGQPAQGKCVSKWKVGARSIAEMLNALAVAQDFPSTGPIYPLTYLLYLLYLLLYILYLPTQGHAASAPSRRCGLARAG